MNLTKHAIVAVLCVAAIAPSVSVSQEYSPPSPLFAPPPQLPDYTLPVGPPPANEEVAPPPVDPFLSQGLPPPTEPLWSPEEWLVPVLWDRSVELGLNSSEGNADAFSMRAGGDMKRKTEFNEIAFDLTYAKATANGVETQHNALFNGSFEQNLGASRWTVFDKLGLEYDEFRAFDVRFWLNAGAGYRFVETEFLTLTGRFGGGASREFGGPQDVWIPEAVFGTDYEQSLGKNHKLSATIDYFPAWEDFTDYRIVAVLGWEAVLSEKHNLSLKVAVNDRYDSTPHGRHPNDVNYAVLLLWKP